MHQSFDDIRALTNRAPLWYDAVGTPRYAPFEPTMLGVYIRFCVLAEIQCQSCGEHFMVGEGHDGFDLWQNPPTFVTLEEFAAHYHYGDPPAHGCVGDTMNCVDLRIIEAWRGPEYAQGDWDWHRAPDIEALNIYPDWAK